MYFQTRLNLLNKTWRFINPEIDIKCKQLWFASNYINKVNNSINKIENQKQSYPDKNIFNGSSQKYI